MKNEEFRNLIKKIDNISENDAHSAAIDRMQKKIQSQGHKVVGVKHNDKEGKTEIIFEPKGQKGTRKKTTISKP